MIAVALGACRQGLPGRLYLAMLNSAGQIVGTPYLAFSGRCDVPVIEDGAETATIAITYESKLIDLDRARERRYTDQDQQAEYPADTGFAFVAALADLSFPVGVAVEGKW
jgi:hypothetical protein